jgi:hypothetical protein
MADEFTPPRRLLYSRNQSRHVLGGISLTQLIRLEQAGLLRRVRPSGKPTGRVFNPAEDVHAVAEGRAAPVEQTDV